MRRAAVQAFRTARCTQGRKGLNVRGSPLWSPRYTLPFNDQSSFPVIQASLSFRNLTLALAGLFASGAWYAYRAPPPPETALSASNNSASSSQRVSTSFQAASPVSPNIYSTSSLAGPNSVTAEQAAESTRKALVVENDQFFTGDIIGDTPISKNPDDSGRTVLEMLTPEQATQRLRYNEESYLVGRGQGVVRFDVVQLASNYPIEDDHAEKIIGIPQEPAATQDGSSSSDWMFWGVFDGHSGWTTSAKLRQVLISFVARELNATYKSALTDPTLSLPTPASIDAAIKKGFLRLDHEIIYESLEKVEKANSKRVAAELLAPALSGSCALLSFYDSKSKLLRVACTGDSRAVLGRRGTSGKWIATPLSEDQTGGTPSEITRLRAEHPGEPYVTRNGRILGGLEPSRAFGDSVYKWSKETQAKIKKNFFGKTPSSLLMTPPYVTAEPIVTTTKVEPEKGDFVVLATDGLWECLTNEEVVGLVGQWLETHSLNTSGNVKDNSSSWLKSWFPPSDVALPVEKTGVTGEDGDGQKKTLRMNQWGVSGSDERFVVEDKNAATHLIRNALGGKDRDMVCALLTLPSPYSRRYRDDLTVEVIFFGESSTGGDVVVNSEASASIADVRAKL